MNTEDKNVLIKEEEEYYKAIAEVEKVFESSGYDAAIDKGNELGVNAHGSAKVAQYHRENSHFCCEHIEEQPPDDE